MERVAFLIEETGERLGCLLNPEGLLVRRAAGISRRRTLGGHVTGDGLTDDALLFTGGGSTEMRLDLLFDVYVAGSSIQTKDVRDLTGPFWRLAENRAGEGYGRPPLVRFVWGKAWNVPGIVTAVSERLENFTAGGAPTRSWLRMSLLRVSEEDTAGAEPAVPLEAAAVELPPPDSLPEDQILTYPLLGDGGGEGGDEPGPAAERLDQIAERLYGNPALWTLVAGFNGIDDPLRLAAGEVLRLPARALLEGRR
jgi:hypothetical protein